MGYQLAFWQREAVKDPDPLATFVALCDREPVDGVLVLPIEEVISAIQAAFPTAVREPYGPTEEWVDWTSEDVKSSFQVEWSPFHVLVELRPLVNEVANTLIGVMAGFRCPLFDPQTGERFETTFT